MNNLFDSQLIHRNSTYELRWLKNYSLEDAQGNILATVHERTSCGNVHRVNFVGGNLHGKSELVDGGLEAAMDYYYSQRKKAGGI